MELIKTYDDFIFRQSFGQDLRNVSRDLFIRMLSFNKDISKTNHWIRFPYYHHVFDDERKGFEKQLRYLKNFGEFISINEVIQMLNGKENINGRYFCLSFDDGYRCCYTNMLEIINKMSIPAIIYLPTDFINLDENDTADLKILEANVPGNPKTITYLNWEQCREMLNAGVIFGSHTKTHANLSHLNKDDIRFELTVSKQIIEKELSIDCTHFACPWGRLNIDFQSEITEPIAKELGYVSFATTNRGKNINDQDCFTLKRDHLLAGWGNYQLKFFFGNK
jgi:peptidoglycan/xylan/chitin deacetylase (PgdA/CDA1 family)